MTAGVMLRAARESAGMSIDDVARATRMRPLILTAMEADDFSHCGGITYARAQLRMIAGVIGLDADEVLESFDAQAPALDY